MATATLDRAETVLPTERQRDEAGKFLSQFADRRSGDQPQMVMISAELFELMKSLLDPIVEGRKLLVVSSLPEELTTTVAAKVLGVSRPTLMRYIREGELSSHKVGSHTRVMRDDVLRFQDEGVERQRRAVQELRELTDRLEI